MPGLSTVSVLAQEPGPPSTDPACSNLPMNQHAFYANCLESRYIPLVAAKTTVRNSQTTAACSMLREMDYRHYALPSTGTRRRRRRRHADEFKPVAGITCNAPRAKQRPRLSATSQS